MLAYLLVAAVVIVAALLAFGFASLLHLQGLAYILFVVFVMLLGIAAAVIILVLHFRAKKRQAEEGLLPAGGIPGELDLLLDEANRKLRTSQQGAKSLDSMPLMYILGDSGTAKTNIVLRSGLDPELVIGAVPQAGEYAPTATLNLWFTRQASLVEVGETIRTNPALLTRLVARTRARAYRSAFGSGAAPRGVIVCVSADQLLAGDAGASLLASARTTGAQLREISRLLGAPVPIYVLITKLDRVPHFEQYVRNLTNTEVAQILGAPLPRTEISAGVYADQASRQIAKALDSISYQLGEFRVETLERENDPANTAGVYEFPREFGKLRKNLNQYLVELCRPSQLSANPYLRGFYFTGVRAQIVERTAAAPEPVKPPTEFDPGATQYLNISMGNVPQGRSPQPPVMVTSRVPQWVFLPRLFPEVILGDKAALTASKQTAPARLFRRILYASLAALFAIYAVLLLVSYLNNAAIESRIRAAAPQLPATGSSSISLPSLINLQALENLRQVITQLDGFQKDHIPLEYRFGLYQGDAMAERARAIYFDRFRSMMLNPAQANFVTFLHGLPDAPPNNGDFSQYQAAYPPLKAYLITTSRPEKSQSQFLTPVFLQYWIGTRQVENDQQLLAQKQIDFYANELLRHPPYNITPDMLVVAHSRSYLLHFQAATRIYQGMLIDADKASASIDFNKLYPGSASCVVDPHIVRGAFTKSGFKPMQDALQHPERYANGEPWVLGDQPGATQNLATVSSDLKSQYTNDYMKEWHAFLIAARSVNCGGLHEAPARLNTLAGASSPLLELFYTVSHNTAVDDPQIKSTFLPTQKVVDPNAQNIFIGPSNKPYIDALLNLSSALDQAAANPNAITDPAAFTQVSQAVSAAKVAAIQTQPVANDPQFNIGATVLSLLQAPIDCANKLVPSAGAAPNGAGQKICATMSPLLGRFPFSPTSTTQASIPEVNAALAPETGAVWAIYNASLNKFLVPSGSQYVSSPTAPQPVTQRFLQYFNRLARISSTLYPAGAKSPSLTFSLRLLPTPANGSAAFVVDGQRVAGSSNSQTFHWDGASAQAASLVYDGKDVLPKHGPWAVFQLVHDAQITHSGSTYRLEYTVDNKTTTTVAGHTIDTSGSSQTRISFELTGPGADALVSEFFSGLACPGQVVK